MAGYERPISIKKVIDQIKKRQYLLPSIQREFVWDTDQIEILFDSLMRDYPISTFLFWKVDKNKVKDFQFYEFLGKYHEKNNRHNRKAEPSSEEDIIAILDGQQRMTSLYIALTGTYAKKLPYYRWENPEAFPEKKLYLNLLKRSDELETEYDFKFLTEAEAEPSAGCFWFECGKILELNEPKSLNKYLTQNKLGDTSKYLDEECDFASDTLFEFFNVIHQKETISFFLEEGNELDKVLQIFIRTNSGGTKLSYSDLLLSIATAQWKDKDAREVIHEFVDSINQIGDGFNFNKDIVLKSCLVLGDFDVKFKVDNFTKENMAKIEAEWDKTSASIRASIELVYKLGFNRDNLAANNTIIPISYFIYKNEFASTIVHSPSREEDRRAIKEWLARVLLKGVFGGQPDSIYPKMREIINANKGKFPLQATIDAYRGKSKSISFSEDDIENILELQYGKPRAYCALSLLYPGLNSAYKYHQDHIHPQSVFTSRKLVKLGIPESDIDQFLAEFNKLPNLQLLEAVTNISKSDKTFEEWVDESYPVNEDKESYLRQNLIAQGQSLKLTDFLELVNQRKKYMRDKLNKILDVKQVSSISEEVA